jgi:protein-disulfide isomerase
MKILLKMIVLIYAFFLFIPLQVLAEIEWQEQQTIGLEKKPVDMVMSARGSYLFVLTEDGMINVYDSAYNLKGKIKAGKDVESIASGPDDNIILLKSKKAREIRAILVEFIQEINIKGAPFMGREDAPVVLIVFTDYQCPYCAKLLPILNQLIENNKETLKIVMKNFPLPMHNFARKAASIALAADTLGKFWEIQEKLYKNTKQMDISLIQEIASDLKVDPDEFQKKMDSKEVQSRISMDIMDGENADVRGTPTIFIDGKIVESRSIKGIQNIINTQLQGKQK